MFCSTVYHDKAISWQFLVPSVPNAWKGIGKNKISSVSLSELFLRGQLRGLSWLWYSSSQHVNNSSNRALGRTFVGSWKVCGKTGAILLGHACDTYADLVGRTYKVYLHIHFLTDDCALPISTSHCVFPTERDLGAAPTESSQYILPFQQWSCKVHIEGSSCILIESSHMSTTAC